MDTFKLADALDSHDVWTGDSIQVLLVIPKYNLVTGRVYDYTFPLGLAYIAKVLKKAGHEVDCLNLNHEEGSPRSAINRTLDSKRYDVVGTGSNSFGFVITQIILDTAREHPSKPKVILGGPILTTEPKLIFETLKPDFGVIGEGEDTVIELLAALKDGTDPSAIPGLIFRTKNSEVVQTPKRVPIENLDSIPSPDLECLGFGSWLEHIHSNFTAYTTLLDNPRVYPLLASRSCPFQCTFCYHDSKYRKRSIPHVMEELRTVVKKYKINFVFIYDDCFSFDKERIFEFCNEIKKLQTEVCWEIMWACQLMVTVTDPELLKTLKDAGCVIISYGFESFSPVVLKSMHKYITPEKMDFAFKETVKQQMMVQANFIFGDVAETKETARETINYWKNNCLGQVNLDFIQPYPGSEIYNHCLRKGIIKDKLEFIKNLTPRSEFNMTDAMNDKELNDLRREVVQLNATYYQMRAIPKHMKRTGENTYSVDVICPHCKQTVTYNNVLILKRRLFETILLCRNCRLRFRLVSPLYNFYREYNSTLKIFGDLYLNVRKKFSEMRMKQMK